MKTLEKQVINIERLMETFKISNKVGQICETGIRRIALTKEDKIMRDIFTGWLKDEGLEVRVDDFGNIYGRRAGLRNDLAPVVTGSHSDTQLYNGRYDGVLGVLTPLEMIKVLNENNVQTLRPIEIVNWTNEEGYRFESGGSEGVSNVSTKEKIYNDKDEEGYSFGEELEKIGYLGDEENRVKEIHSYVEIHIEQGPVLEQENKSIGVVEGDTGFEMVEFIIKGKTGHSTGTPMEGRKDALIKAAEIIVAAQGLTKELNGTLTIGKLDIEPGANSHIVSEVKIPMSILHEDQNARDHLVESIKEKSIDLVEKEKMEIEINLLFTSPLVRFSERIRSEIETTARNFGYSSLNMMSKGFHDANNITNIAPTGMIFIPCKDGISHNVEEFASEEDIEKGANVLLNTVLTLAQLEETLE